MGSREHIVRVTTTGSAGSATGTGYTDELVTGFVMGVYVNYQSAPGTTTVVSSEDGGAARTILSLSAGNTDVFKVPVVAIHDTSGTAISDQYTHPFIAGRKIKVVVDDCDALTDAVIVTIVVRD